MLCEYSKFRIKSNSYLLFDSIRNWCNYSKFSNTYLTVISRTTETHWGASHKPLHSPDTEPSAVPCVCAYPSHSLDHHMGAATGASLDRDIRLHYNGGRQTQHWTFCQYCYGFKFAFRKKTNLTSLLLRTSKTIRFDSKFRIIVQHSIRFDSKWKKYSHSTSFLCVFLCV